MLLHLDLYIYLCLHLDMCKTAEITLSDHPKCSVNLKSVGSFKADSIELLDYDEEYDYSNTDYTSDYVEGDRGLPPATHIFLLAARVALEEASSGDYSGPHDLALVKLSWPLKFGPLIQPICLPLLRQAPLPASETSKFQDTNVEANIGGYGKLIPSDGTNCLTNGRGKMRYHPCRNNGWARPCEKSAPPGGEEWEAGGSQKESNLWGPHGWCKVKLFEGEKEKEEEQWGFCSKSCEVSATMPMTYHEQARVDILPKERCQKLLEGLLVTPYDSKLELCAGSQTFLDNTTLPTPIKKASAPIKEAAVAKPAPAVVMRETVTGDQLFIAANKEGEAWMVEVKEPSGDRLVKVRRNDGILGGVDACQGDSGGPLWVEWDHKATQVHLMLKVRLQVQLQVLVQVQLNVCNYIHCTTRRLPCRWVSYPGAAAARS